VTQECNIRVFVQNDKNGNHSGILIYIYIYIYIYI
jgi:hypothetical protein